MNKLAKTATCVVCADSNLGDFEHGDLGQGDFVQKTDGELGHGDVGHEAEILAKRLIFVRKCNFRAIKSPKIM